MSKKGSEMEVEMMAVAAEVIGLSEITFYTFGAKNGSTLPKNGNLISPA